MKSARSITLTTEERSTLLRWSRGRSTPARQVLQANIVLLAADGLMNMQIAERLKTAKKTVSLWRTRFAEQGLAGIERDAPRPGRKPAIRQSVFRKLLAKTTQEKPPNATHWSTRTMAKAVGVSHATVQRVLAPPPTTLKAPVELLRPDEPAWPGPPMSPLVHPDGRAPKTWAVVSTTLLVARVLSSASAKNVLLPCAKPVIGVVMLQVPFDPAVAAPKY